MRNATALDDPMTAAPGHVESADIVVGIPSYRNAVTVGHVVRTVVQGPRASFGHMRAAIVNADGGPDGGTPDAVRAALGDHPGIVGAYRGLPGKGSAFRAILEAAERLGARGRRRRQRPAQHHAAVDGAPPRPGRGRAGRPRRAAVRAARARRHDHEHHRLSVTRALQGLRVRQPICGEFAFDGSPAAAFLEGGALGGSVRESDVAPRHRHLRDDDGPRAARAGRAGVPRGEDPRPEGPRQRPRPMFRQVVGTLFRAAGAARRSRCSSPSRSRARAARA